MKQKLIIPIFIPHYGCSHLCIFCNQKKITGQTAPVTGESVRKFLRERLATIAPTRQIEVAFYGGSFTALPLTEQQNLLAPAAEYLHSGLIHSIRLSTRPDCINRPILHNLKEQGVSIVELGVQSLDDNVLMRAERGHTAAQVTTAVALLREQQFTFGIQLMPGLPGENSISLLKTTVATIAFKPHMVRIYPVVVLAGTPLARMYECGEYVPLSLEQAISKAAMMKRLFNEYHIPVIRTGLQATEELDQGAVTLAGPYHPAFGELVTAYLYRQKIEQWLEEAKPSGNVGIHCPAREESKIRGQKNQNLRYWSEKFSCTFSLIPHSPYSDFIILFHEGAKYVIKKQL